MELQCSRQIWIVTLKVVFKVDVNFENLTSCRARCRVSRSWRRVPVLALSSRNVPDSSEGRRRSSPKCNQQTDSVVCQWIAYNYYPKNKSERRHDTLTSYVMRDKNTSKNIGKNSGKNTGKEHGTRARGGVKLTRSRI